MNGLDSKSADLRVLGVRLPLPAPHKNLQNERLAGANSPHETHLKQTQRISRHLQQRMQSLSH